MSEHEHEHKHAPSSHTSTHGTRWMGWTLGLLAVPVVYVLTFPPLMLTTLKIGGQPAIINPPQWLLAYSAPYDWLIEETPLRLPLVKYTTWWTTLFVDDDPSSPRPLPMNP